jgi:Icc protein
MNRPERTLIQFSDVHITPEGQSLEGGVDSLANIAQALAEVEAIAEPISALIFSGDLADKGDRESYDRLRAVVEPAARRIGAPVIYAMGNHDERGPFRAGLLGDPESTDSYDHVAVVDGVRVITLDSTVPGHHHGELDAEQLSWLREQLSRRAPGGTVLVLHHPPIPTPIDLAGITLTDPAALATVVLGTDVRLIVCGHAHHSSAGSLAGIPVWMAGSTAYRLDARTPNLRAVPGGVYTRIDLFQDAVLATDMPIGQSDHVLYEHSADELAALIAAHTATTAHSA